MGGSEEGAERGRTAREEHSDGRGQGRERGGHLVGGPELGVFWAGRALVVGEGGVGLEGVAEHVESGGCSDRGRHRGGVVWVNDAEGRAEVAVPDPCLGLEGRVVEDSDTCVYVAG